MATSSSYSEAGSLAEEDSIACDELVVVSVVVPAYNAAAFIKRCLDSIAVALHDIPSEVIIVNDGSSDDTESVAEGISLMHRDWHVITTENSGVAEARNRGMRAASGRYLVFVDADDELIADGFKEALREAEHRDVDMLFTSHERWIRSSIRTEGYNSTIISNEVENSDRPRDVLIKLLASQLGGACWRILFRRRFLLRNGITFPPRITMAEDYLFIARCLSCSPQIGAAPHRFYRYIVDDTSSTQRYMPRLEHDVKFVDMAMIGLCEGDSALEELEYENIVNSHYSMLMNLSKPGAPVLSSHELRGHVRRLLCDQSLVRAMSATGHSRRFALRARRTFIRLARAFPLATLWLLSFKFRMKRG